LYASSDVVGEYFANRFVRAADIAASQMLELLEGCVEDTAIGTSFTLAV